MVETDAAGRMAAAPRRSTPLAVGDSAPRFTLPSSLGQPVSLDEHLRDGPVVVAWYLFDFGRV